MKFLSFLFAVVLALGFLASTPALAQLAPPNDLGIALGHIHLVVKDVEAHRQFWTRMMGGTLVTNGPLSMIEFPGVFIMLRQGEPTGPAAGSIVDHFGFVLKDLPAARARWKAGNVTYEAGATNPNQGYVHTPDGIRVEVFGDPSLPGPISMDHIHTYPMEADIPAMQAWYAKVFGGLPGKRQRVASPGLIDCDYFHRFNLSFSRSDMKLAPTKGRSLDHIGFDVKNLEEFAKKLEAQGIKFDAPPRQIPNSQTKVAFLADPWGTYIEVSENLAPARN
jgi:catechol 2,3-dioxygenase-like lactoylglutathione lyase family enzyme